MGNGNTANGVLSCVSCVVVYVRPISCARAARACPVGVGPFHALLTGDSRLWFWCLSCYAILYGHTPTYARV